MQIVEYGKKNQEVIILLHGGGLSWWNYRAEVLLLEQRFHVLIPILDGHANSDKEFTSIQDNAKELLQFIDENYNGQVHAIGGLSLGGQILVELLSIRNDVCELAVIESALVLPMPLTGALIGPSLTMSYGLIKKLWFSKLQFKSLKITSKLFDDYYRDTCKIKKTDMTGFLKSNANYALNPMISKTKAKTVIAVGSKEQKKMLQSAKMLNEAIPDSKLLIIGNYYHGELSLNHPDEYVRLFD